jgi:hypothetical protein
MTAVDRCLQRLAHSGDSAADAPPTELPGSGRAWSPERANLCRSAAVPRAREGCSLEGKGVSKGRPGRSRGGIEERWRSEWANVRWLPDRLSSTASACGQRGRCQPKVVEAIGASLKVALLVSLPPKLRVTGAQTENMAIYLRRTFRVLSFPQVDVDSLYT